MQVQSQLLCPTNQLLNQTWSQLVDASVAMGNLQDALLPCQKVTDTLCSNFASNSTAIAYHKLQLADLLRQLGETTQADTQSSAAMNVLHLHFGHALESA